MKNVRIRSFSGPYFPSFGLNVDISDPNQIFRFYSVEWALVKNDLFVHMCHMFDRSGNLFVFGAKKYPN